MLRRLVRTTLKNLGYTVMSTANSLTVGSTMEAGLFRCASRGLKAGTVIDVGASNGMWSRLCMKYFPDAHYLLVEAQAPHTPALSEMKANVNKMDFVVAAAGRARGTVYFDAADLFGGVAYENPSEASGNCVQLPVVAIDDEVQSRNLPSPYVLKLDTHGFEVPILEGAATTLKNCSLVIIECYNFQLQKESLRFHEMIKLMEEKGFRTIDIIDVLRRRNDRALWQADLFFIPANDAVFQQSAYS